MARSYVSLKSRIRRPSAFLDPKPLSAMRVAISVPLQANVSIKVPADHHSVGLIEGEDVGFQELPEVVLLSIRVTSLWGVARDDVQRYWGQVNLDRDEAVRHPIDLDDGVTKLLADDNAEAVGGVAVADVEELVAFADFSHFRSFPFRLLNTGNVDFPSLQNTGEVVANRIRC